MTHEAFKETVLGVIRELPKYKTFTIIGLREQIECSLESAPPDWRGLGQIMREAESLGYVVKGDFVRANYGGRPGGVVREWRRT